jgi:DNA-binding transcriptional regulator/RsmH inhibitor MraZ
VTVAVSLSWAKEMTEAVKRGEKTRAELRAMAANMVEVAVDSQGRVTLDDNLRQFAGLSVGSKVIVSGAFDSVEIWEPNRFARMLAAGEGVIAGEDR